MYLAVAGNIGVGKSTLTRLLAKHYHFTPMYEAVDENPYLPDFYRDMQRYAFHSQLFFLSTRLEQHLLHVNPGNRLIQDRCIYEDAAIFARNLFETGILDARDYQCYLRMYQAICQTLRPPDLLIYLRASVSRLQQHIRQRGRQYEQGISEDYLRQLNTLYESWIAGYSLSDVLIIDMDRLDPLEQPSDLQKILDLLGEHGMATPVL